MTRRNLLRVVVYLPPLLLAVLMLAFAGLWYTEPGTRLLVSRLLPLVEGLSVEHVSGTAANRLRVTNLRYQSPQIDITLAAGGFAIDGYALLGARVGISRVDIDGLQIAWRNAETPEDGSEPAGIPVPIDIRPASILDIKVSVDGGAPIAIDELSGSVALRRTSISAEIDTLRQADLAVTGALAIELMQPTVISGRYRTLSAPVAAAGTFDVEPDDILMTADLTAPYPATVKARLRNFERIELDATSAHGHVNARGDLALRDGPAVQLQLQGDVMKQPIEGDLTARLGDSPAADLSLLHASGANTIAASLRGASLKLDAGLEGLSSLVPGLSGSAGANVVLDVRSLTLDGSASASGLAFDGTPLGRGDLRFDGTVAATTFDAEWQREAMTANLGGEIAVEGGDVTVRLSRSVVTTGEIEFMLTRATTLRFDDGRPSLGEACWASSLGQGELCLFEADLGERVEAGFRINDLDVRGVSVPEAAGRLEMQGGIVQARASAALLNVGERIFNDVSIRADGPIDALAIEANAETPWNDQTALLNARLIVDPANVNIEALTFNHANNRLEASGRLDIDTRQLTAEIEGSWLGQPVSGDIAFDTDGLTGNATARVGDDASLSLAAEANSLDVAFVIDSLQALDKQAYGAVEGGAVIKLEPQSVSAWLNARQLYYGANDIESLTATAIGGSNQPVHVAVGLGGITAGGVWLGNGLATAIGTLSDLNLTALLQSDSWRFETSAQAAIDGSSVDGRIESGELDAIGRTWNINAPVEFRVTDGTADTSPHCWQGETSALCVTAARYDRQSAEFRASLNKAPIRIRGLPWAPEVNIDGEADLDIEISARAPFGANNVTANATLDVQALAVRYFDEETMDWRLTGEAEVAAGVLEASLVARADDQNHVNLSASIPDLTEPTRYRANANLESNTLSVVTAFVPSLDRAEGTIGASARVDTSGSQPIADFRVAVEEGASIVVPAAGIEVQNIAFNARGDADRITLSLSGRSGDGMINVDGEVASPLSSDRRLTAAVRTDRFRAANRQDIALVTSADVEVNYQRRATQVRGKVTVNDGKFTTAGLGARTRSISSDVVVVSRPPESSLIGPLELKLDFDIEQFAVDLYGLKGGVEGNLSLTQQPPAARRATGNVNLVSGTFERYGQKFLVERGRLIFAGPIATPLVDVVSVREIVESDRTVRVTLLLSGPANNLKSSISASPAMSESQALSYLVLGRPLESTERSEEDMLGAAALALGLRQARVITEELRESLGLEELTITSSGFDSTSIIGGKRFGDDLYIEYAYDIMGRIGGVTVEYQLTDRLSLQTRSGEATSMRLVYSIE